MKRSPALATLLALSITLTPTLAFGQGFEFGVDEAEEVAEESEESAEEQPVDTQDPAGLEFTEEDAAKKTTYSDTEVPQVAVVAVSGPAMDPDRRQKVQTELEEVAGEIPNITVLSGSAILGALEQAGGDDCVQEPLCLADVGESAGVSRILVARVVEKPDGLELKVDYFDVDDKLFVKYHNTPGLGGTPAVVDAVKPALDEIFDIRSLQQGPEVVGDEDTGVVQTVLAYGTAGLAVGSLAAGIIFGIGAKKIEKDVQARPQTGDVYDMTQVEAREAIRPAEAKATTANVFYGLAIGLGAVSALLFYIKGGSDVAEDQEVSSRTIHDLQIAPAVTSDGFGVGAAFRF